MSRASAVMTANLTNLHDLECFGNPFGHAVTMISAGK